MELFYDHSNGCLFQLSNMNPLRNPVFLKSMKNIGFQEKTKQDESKTVF